jgi:hypothetical protein
MIAAHPSAGFLFGISQLQLTAQACKRPVFHSWTA